MSTATNRTALITGASRGLGLALARELARSNWTLIIDARGADVLEAEVPSLRIYWVDPGDMRTQMHQEAFPGEDISDRPLPEVSVPGLIALLTGKRASGRYAARALAEDKQLDTAR